MDDAALDRVEKQRIELEESIAKLRKSLRHWQALEIDYEGLKEEFDVLPDDASAEECLRAAQDFNAEIVDDVELRSLVISRVGGHKAPYQVADVLAKRIEYVSRNVITIQKQLSDAEKKRNALLLAADSEHRDEAGLPLTEITEELDDEGHVISTKLQTPDHITPQLVEVLKKAGVKDVMEKKGKITTTKSSQSTLSLAERHFNQTKGSPEASVTSSTIGLDAPEHLQHSSKPDRAEARVDEVPDPLTADHRAASDSRGTTPSAKSEDSTPLEHEMLVPARPQDTLEDATLRQEMLQYGLDEVGTIVAQLDLEEGASELSYEEEDADILTDSELDMSDEDEDEESEDEWGMSKSPVISDKYKRKMEQLEKQLGTKDIRNLGPSPSLSQDVIEQLDRPPAAEAAAKAAIARSEAAARSSQTKGGAKARKRVAFADALDIAPAEEVGGDQSAAAVPRPSRATHRPVGETIVERAPGGAAVPSFDSPSEPIRKMSRFKATRTAGMEVDATHSPAMDTVTRIPQSVSPIPTGKIVLDTLVERPGPKDPSHAPPPDPNNIDDDLHRRQIATEYQMRRNRLIHQQGGYVGGGEEDNYGEELAPLPVEDEVTGKVKKMSRFRAARLK